MELVLKGIMIVSLGIFAALFVFSIVIFATHHKTGGALFVPTPRVLIRKIIESVDFSRFRDVRELGTGDGRFISTVERVYGTAVTGYEINPIAFVITAFMLANKKSKVFFRDFWSEDFSGVDCIYCYLFPDVMKRLGEKLAGELPEGAWVISANFPIPGWQEDRTLRADNTIFDDPVYVYIMGNHIRNNA